MTDLNNKEEFACLYEQVSDLEIIRNSVDEDEPKDKAEKSPFRLIGGIQVRESGDE